MNRRPTRAFTGYHMAAILIAFFGVVIAVNTVMATYATRTFGGVVVENSYVASQQFNHWLKAARRQDALGWKPQLGVDAERRVTVAIAVQGASITGYAEHPLGRLADVPLSFTGENGRYRSSRPLPAGRWAVHLVIRHGGEEARVIERLS